MNPVPVTLSRGPRPGAAVPRPPGSPHLHPFASSLGHHVLVPDGSRVYDIDAALHAELTHAIERDDSSLAERLAELGLHSHDAITTGAGTRPPVRYLSLAVAQQCNLACTYCYADGGDFGGEPANMDVATGREAIDRLIEDCAPGDRVGLAFMGGEPLANRRAVHLLTAHADARAREREVSCTFSITTNGTMLRPVDIDLFDAHAFAVTVSLDGVGEVHDRLRPTRSGAGTYTRILDAIAPMLARQGRLQATARATVTPSNLGLRATLDELVGLGFHGVGFAPALATPSGAAELAPPDLDRLLRALIECSDEFRRRLARRERYPFTNLTSALQLIHAGAHRPYPCGAGAAYLGIAADGSAAACHRFVGAEVGRMGDVATGWDDEARSAWLADRHVDRQEPCRDCWARYLCGGGCHHEVLSRGRHACDFVRSWLDHCLVTYAEVSTLHPWWFAREVRQRPDFG